MSQASDKTQQPRQRRGRANQRRILKVALQIVLEDGIDALSLRRVADRADYTAAALYRYFDSRDALLADVAVHVITELGAQIERARERSHGTVARVCAAIDTYRDLAKDDPHAFSLIAAMVGDRRHLVDEPALIDPIMNAIVGILAPVQADLNVIGEARDGDDVRSDGALALFGAVHGTLLLAKLQARAPGYMNADALACHVATTLLVGWGASIDDISLRPST